MEFPKGDNERELTSTMDNVTSMSIKDEKSDTSDATPTSSTDANTSTARTDIVSDDPISSTSSDIGYQVNSKMDQNDISAPKLSAEDVKKGSAGDSENDLLGISNVSGEKITEDVEDLVHDLESLLGEPAPTFTVSSQHAKVAETKNVLADQESTSQVDDESSEEKKEHQVPEFQEKDTSEKCGEDENSPEIADESTVEEKRSDDGEIVQIESTEDVVAEEASGESSRSDEKDSGESCIIESSVEIVEIAKNEAESSSATTSDHCIQDQDITRSEPKEKEDCDRLEVTKTGCTDEDQASDSQDEVDTTVVSTEPDTVVTATEEIKGVPEEDTPSEEAQEVEDDSAEVDSKSKVTESTSDEAIEEADVEDVTDVDDLNAPETSDVILPTEDDSKQEKPESGDASLDEALPVIVENTELLPSAEKETKTESAEPSADDKTVLDSELVLEHESNPCVEAENNSTEPVDTGAPDIDSDPAENAEESDVAENSPKVVSDATVSQVADEEHDSGDCEVPNEEEKTESVEPSESGDVKLDSGPQSVEAGGKDKNEELVAGDCEPSQTDDVTAEDADKAVNSTSDTVEQNEVATSEEDKHDEDLKEPVESDFQPEPVTIAENCELADIQDTDETVVTKEVRAEVVVEADTNSDDSKDQSNDVDPPPTDTEEILSSADLKSTKVTPVEQSEAQEVSGSPEGPTSVENLEADKKCEDKTVCISDDEQESPMVESPQEDTPSKLNAVAQKPKYVEPGPLNLSEESDEEDIPTLVLDVEPPAADVVVTNQEEEVADAATPEAPTLPEVEDILINSEIVHPGVSEQHIAPDNLETILAVASLQNIDVPKGEERLLTEKERREMEALRKAVESITEPGSDYENVADEFIPEIEQAENAEVPAETVVESEAIGLDSDEMEMIVESEEIKSVEPVSVENDVGFEVPDEESDTSKDLDSVAKENDIEALPAPKSDVNNEEGDSAASVNSIEGISDQNLDNEANVSSVNKNCAEGDSDEVKEATDIVVEVHDDNQVEEAKSEVAAEVVENNLSKQSDMTENVLPDSSQTVSEPETDSVGKESKTKANERPKRFRKATDSKLEELSINVDVPDKEKPYSPKITIKPIKVPDEEVSTTSNSDSELVKGSLKMTITKQSDKMHSIVKMSEAEASEPAQEQEDPLPKLKIKPKFQVEPQKMSTRSSKQVASSSNQRSGSPRITIKPVVKPEKQETLSPLKIKIGLKSEEPARKHSPKFNIKPIAKPDEEQSKEVTQSPRKVLIKPIVKPPEEMDQPPKITIKPIPKPEPEKEITITPKLNIKPIKKPEEEVLDTEHERSSPKIIIKPIVKPQESEAQSEERIVLKINKGNIESKKRERQEEERLAKITVKISKEGGHHIVQPEDCQKRPHEESNYQEKNKKQKVEVELVTSTRSRVKETPAETIGDSKGSPVETRSKHKDVSVESPKPKDNPVSPASKHKDPTLDSPVELKRAKLRDSKQKENIDHRNEEAAMIERKLDSPIVISDDSRSQDSGSCLIINDSSRNTPVSDVSTESAKVTPETSVSNAAPVPKKRGRPRKVPLEVRPDFKDDDLLPQPVKEEPLAPTVPVHESGRPKRSCRGQSALDTLGLKPRKPRGPGRGRGSARGMGTRAVAMKPQKSSK